MTILSCAFCCMLTPFSRPGQREKKPCIGAELFDSTDVSRIGNTGSPFRSSTRASFAAHHDVPAVVQGHGLIGRHCTVLVYLEPLFLIVRDPRVYGYRKDLCTHVQPSGNNLLRNALTDKCRIDMRAQGDLDIKSTSIPLDSPRWKDSSSKARSFSRLSFS